MTPKKALRIWKLSCMVYEIQVDYDFSGLWCWSDIQGNHELNKSA